MGKFTTGQDALDWFAQGCKGAIIKGDELRARCPAHNGKGTTSLSVTISGDKILVNCFGDCETDAVLDALDLTAADLFLGPSESSPAGKTIECTYAYHDAHGAVLYESVRLIPKNFLVRRPGPDGRYIWNLNGVTRVPYHLPELLQAVATHELIAICEGEKDADNVRRHFGMPATCSVGGEGQVKYWKELYKQHFRDARVAIFPHKDRAGKKYAKTVAQALDAFAVSIKIVELPELKEGGDISDWIQAGGTREQLDELVAAAPELKGDKMAASSDMYIGHVPTSEINPENVDWLWWPYLAKGTVAMLDGDPGVGKSLLTILLASVISKGWSLPDQQGKLILTTNLSDVLLFASEDSAKFTIRPRIDRSGGDPTRIHLVTGLFGESGEDIGFTLEHVDALRDKLRELHPALVILDPIQAYLGKIDMHRANETRPLMSALGKTAEEFMSCILCVRHPAKPGQGTGKVLLRGLGSVDLIGAARTGLFVEDHPLDRNKVLLMQSKSNLGPKGRTQIFSRADGTFEWAGVTRADAEAICGVNRGPDPYSQLEALFRLEEILGTGVPQPSSDVEEQLTQDSDMSHKTIMRARKRLGVQANRQRTNGEDKWYLHLPSLEMIPPPTLTTTSPSSPSSPTRPTRVTCPSSTNSNSYNRASQEGQTGQVGQETQEGQVGQVVIRAREDESSKPDGLLGGSWLDDVDPNF
jgi:putative DNA primase/helicase